MISRGHLSFDLIRATCRAQLPPGIADKVVLAIARDPANLMVKAHAYLALRELGGGEAVGGAIGACNLEPAPGGTFKLPETFIAHLCVVVV